MDIKAFNIFQYYTTVLGSSRIMYVVYWWYDELYIIALDIKLISWKHKKREIYNPKSWFLGKTCYNV